MRHPRRAARLEHLAAAERLARMRDASDVEDRGQDVHDGREGVRDGRLGRAEARVADDGGTADPTLGRPRLVHARWCRRRLRPTRSDPRKAVRRADVAERVVKVLVDRLSAGRQRRNRSLTDWNCSPRIGIASSITPGHVSGERRASKTHPRRRCRMRSRRTCCRARPRPRAGRAHARSPCPSPRPSPRRPPSCAPTRPARRR